MVGASMKNTLARRNHKERSQPLHRKKLGLLEKHKDYVQRARDYNSKQARIQKLREKAAFRNKDEFYYGMIKGKTANGVAVVDRGNEVLGNDVVKLLKSQDAGYIRIQIAKDEKHIGRIRSELEVSARTQVAGPSGSSGIWDAAAEVAEVEKLAEMGVVLSRRKSESSSTSRKGKGKETVGHIVFAEVGENVTTVPQTEADGESGEGAHADEEIAVDLGWEEAKPKKAPKARKKPQVEIDPSTVEEGAREQRLELLTTLSALLSRVKLLRQAEARLSITKAHMSTRGGRAIKVREAGWVDDDTQEEDRNGEKKRFENKLWKWKLERRR